MTFQSTLSSRRATLTLDASQYDRKISIHALLTESDYCAPPPERIQSSFQSTLSSRRATPPRCSSCMMVVFQSTLSSRRATGRCGERGCIPFHFNPRSPHGERLSPISRLPARDPNFNPRSPHGERPAPPLMRTLNHRTFQSTLSSRRATCAAKSFAPPQNLFQSTLSSRRATMAGPKLLATTAHFNPRSPHGERRAVRRCQKISESISIHALLTESDLKCISLRNSIGEFQSTLSSRRATCGYDSTLCHRRFQSTLSSRRATIAWASSASLVAFQSTLSSRRATGIPHFSKTFLRYFNPRSPHGERRAQIQHGLADRHISIHALLTESDDLSRAISPSLEDFNPRSPHGERPLFGGNTAFLRNFNPRSPHGERPDKLGRCLVFSYDFNPRSPHGERPPSARRGSEEMSISIHALLTESDRFRRGQLDHHRHFNPRSPHGERPRSVPHSEQRFVFQSTLSSRRATTL